MSAPKDGVRAFPVLHTIDGNWVKEPLDEYMGMTLRDYFAAKALQGATAGGVEVIRGCVESGRHRYGRLLDADEAMARAVYDMADAILKVRNK